MFVSHYVSKFIQLSHFAPKLIVTKSKKAKKHLRADIFDQIALMKYATYMEDLENA